MLKFTGQKNSKTADLSVSYRTTQDEELCQALIQSIRALTAAVVTARGIDISGEPEDIRWAKEFLVGFSLLAIGEARSILLLLSDYLNRHARVHLRSLYEYELRTKKLLSDPQAALAFRDSLAYEMRHIGGRLRGSMNELEREISETLGVPDAREIRGMKESKALGGTVFEQMRGEVAAEQRYVGTYAWASLVSHGSILALRELSRAVDGAGDDLLTRAADDDKGATLIYHACWLVLLFCLKINQQFGVVVADGPRITKTLIAVNKRLKLIPEEVEARAAEAIKEHRRKNPGR